MSKVKVPKVAKKKALKRVPKALKTNLSKKELLKTNIAFYLPIKIGK